MTLKRFCDKCGVELVYNHITLSMICLPNPYSVIDINKDLCLNCGKVVRKAIGFALGKIKDAH